MRNLHNINIRFRAILALAFATTSLAADIEAKPFDAEAAEAPNGLSTSEWHSIRTAHSVWMHEFKEVDGMWQARNPGQRWTTTFDGRGFTTNTDGADWTWGLKLLSYGFAENRKTVSGTPQTNASGQKFSYFWEDGLEEWFVNDQRGLEHGFNVPERPQGASPGEPLVFTISTLGSLRPTISKDTQTVHFRDKAGGVILNYSGLKVWDADGVTLNSRFEQAEDGQFRIAVDESEARYPITIDPIAQQAYLKASNAGQVDYFGYAVAVSGDTVVIGAYGEDGSATVVNGPTDGVLRNSGAAYVFVRNGGTWMQQAYLKASNSSEDDYFGEAVAISEDTIIIGARRRDTTPAEYTGQPGDSRLGSGAAYVFVRNGTTWSQQAYLKASNFNGGDYFGHSVAVAGDTLVVGAIYEDSSTVTVNSVPDESAVKSGAAYVFERTGTAWIEQAYLKATNAGAGDEFGTSVAVSGNTILVGAVWEDGGSSGVNGVSDDALTSSGASYVFVRNGVTWSQQAYLKASNTGEGYRFGNSVALSGDTAVVGSYTEDSRTTGVNSTPNENGESSGAAYVFVRDGENWSQQAYLKASNTFPTDYFGYSVSISENTLVVGAHLEKSSTTGVNSTQNFGAFHSGAAYVFVRNGITWSEQAYLKASNTGENDHFGYSVGISGDTVVIGAPEEDSGSTGVNSIPDERFIRAGAAYVFSVEPPPPEFNYSTTLGNVTITGYNGLGGDVVIPRTLDGNPVTAIGDYAFQNKNTITSVVVPEGVTHIRIGAFSNCMGITSVTLPDSLTSIGTNSFFACTDLTDINLPPNLEAIGTFAFSGCGSLTVMVVPESVMAIGSHAFQLCSELTGVVLPSGLERIEANTFHSCSSLESIVIPASVNFIGSNAFLSCTTMQTVFFLGNAPAEDATGFANAASNFSVYFLTGSTGFTTPAWNGYPSAEVLEPIPQSPIFLSQPQDRNIAAGTTKLSAFAAGIPTPAYQWFSGISGNVSSPVSGATSAFFTTPVLTLDTQYWVRATNNEGIADSRTVTVVVAPPSKLLSDLVLNSGTLSPGFNRFTTTYTANVPSFTTSLSVTPTAEFGGADITVNGSAVMSGTASIPISLAIGGNQIEIVVTVNGTSKNYSLTITRAQNPTITTEATTGVTASSVVVNGTVDPKGTASVYFEYGPTASYGNATPSQIVSGNEPLPFQANLSGLPADTTVHYRAVANGGAVLGVGLTSMTLSSPVIVGTGNPVVTAPTTAKLVGAVDTQGLPMSVYFEYGLTNSYGNTTPREIFPANIGIKDVLHDVADLIPGAIYFVRLVAEVPGRVVGNGVKFKVKVVPNSGTGSPTDVPLVTTGEAVELTESGASLKGAVNSRGGTTTAFFQYGTTPAYGLKTERLPVGNDTLDAEVSIPVKDLLPGTRYYYRLMASNSLGTSIPDAGGSFDTKSQAPVVTTGAAAALTTTSVTVRGTVRARNSDATVDILFGTNPNTLSNGASAIPDLLTGDAEVAVSADLGNLLQSVTYFYQVRAVNSGGTTLGQIRSFQAANLSGLFQGSPSGLPSSDHQGILRVNLAPSQAGGGWRLEGEQEWRNSGTAISGLTSGDRVVEFRAVSGFLAPSSETVAIVSGNPAVILNRSYTESDETRSGSLIVELKPSSSADTSRPVAARAQWRLLGQSAGEWKNTGVEVTGLPPGNHVIECKPISGRSTPPPASAVITDGATQNFTLTYFEADAEVGSLPDVLAFNQVADSEDLPFSFVGQLRSDLGSATGFVVRPRVVATVAHTVFDDGTLAAVTGLQWLFQRHRDVYEPTPLVPRGFYTMTGYAAQRAADNSPGISTPESQHLDAAAVFFAEDAGRGSFSGFLASDLDDNEFLLSSGLKTLVGYPVENISATNRDRMHATTLANITFTRPPGQTRTFITQNVRSTGGNSGGPICILGENGKFYPAAIYLGGTGQTVVRAIDSDVSTLFGFAEVSANGASSAGSGSITDSNTEPSGTPGLGSLKVVIEPAGARNAGAGWRIGSDSYLASDARLDSLSPNSYGIQFSSVSGFEPPASPSVDIVDGELKTVTFTYEIIVQPPVINSPAQRTVNRNEDLLYQITATNSPDMFSLSGLLPLGTVFDPATGRLTGVPQEAGKFPVVVGVSNAGGTDTLSVEITSLPTISPQTVNTPFQEELNFQIVSSEDGEGALFEATNLPAGLALDENTGGISGVPTVPGTYLSEVTVSRKGASQSAIVTFEIVGELPSFVFQPTPNLTIEYGSNVVLSVATGGLPIPTVQWYRGLSGDTSQLIPGATGSSYASDNLISSANFWARISNLSGFVDSNTSSIQVLPSTNANLAFLGLDSGSLSPFFNSARTSYTTNVPNTVASFRVTPSVAVPVSTTTINGISSPINVPGNPIALSVGSNTLTIRVTAQDGITTKDYAVTVNRAAAPAVTTLGSDGINDVMANIRGSVNPGGNGTVFFEYGLTTSYGSRTASRSVSGASAVPVSATITGLSGGTTYHYRVAFSDGGAPVFGNNMTFTTGANRPLIVTGGSANISETGATLIGIVDTRNLQANVHFEYGTNQALLGTTTTVQNIEAGTKVEEFIQPISGLSAGVTYFYRAVATRPGAGEQFFGETQQFTAQITTEVGDGRADDAPEIIPGSEQATDVLADSAVLKTTVNPNDGSTLVFFEYGTTASYGFRSEAFRIGNGTGNALVTIPLENLETGATYFFRAIAENAEGVASGNGGTFTTAFPGAIVTTGQAAGISTRSARVNGNVQANGTTRDVFFHYGTDGVNFPQSVRAFQQTVGGTSETPVHVDLVNLEEGVTYFYKLVATEAGESEGIEGEVRLLNPSFLVGFERQEPRPVLPSERQGQLTVNLFPSGTGNWRFSGEKTWRASGESAGNLTSGDRLVEFRPVAGFIQPPTELAGFTDGDSPLPLDRSYYRSAENGSGSIQVNLIPAALADVGIPEAERAQWRVAGGADLTWKNSGDTTPGLRAGTYLIESKLVTGNEQPVLASAKVSADQITPITITYFQRTDPAANEPIPLDFATVNGSSELPYAHVGRIRSNLGSHSGFVVKPRVVATAAQAVFDEVTLSTVGGLQWLLQEHEGTHEPKPVAPRGTYVFTGYDAQRSSENTPGTLSPDSQDLNVAALYFFEDAGRGGFSGFLASDEPSNEFLVSTSLKILAGYPTRNNRMHATSPDSSTLTPVQGKLFSSSIIGGAVGMSGGPLSIQYEGGAYYPAGIYVGGKESTLIRAIDSGVIDLFTRAEVSGNGGDNNVGGGISHTSIVGNLAPTQAGAIRVIIEPTAANTAGARWQLDPEPSMRPGGSQKSGLSPGSYDLKFTSIPGFFVPAIQSITVTGGQLTTVTFTYEEGAAPMDTWRFENFATYSPGGFAANDQDPDKDGVKNIDEFTAGTDPNSASDFFQLTIATKTGNTFTTGCAGKAGRIYTLQRNTDLNGAWTDVTSEGPLLGDAPVSLSDTSAPPKKSFYRIQVSVP